MENNTLTDQEVEVLNDTLEEVDSPSRDALKEASLSDEHLENFSEVVNVITSPDGRILPITEDTIEYSNKSMDQAIEDDEEEYKIDFDTMEIKDDSVNTVLSATFEDYKPENISVDDYDKIKDNIRRVLKGERFAYYAQSPQIIKDMISAFMTLETANKMGNYVKEGLNYVAYHLYKEMGNDAELDHTMYDIQHMVSNLGPDLVNQIQQDEYWYSVRKYFLYDVLENAYKFDRESVDELEKGNEEEYTKKSNIAKRYRAIHDSFVESYTYEDMMYLYKLGKLRVKRIEKEKFNRTCNSFDLLFRDTKTTIKNITQVIPYITKAVEDGVTEDEIKEFVCIFIKYVFYKNLKADRIVDYTLMYFFIYNLITVCNYDHNNEDDIKFHFKHIDSINTFFKLIREKLDSKNN